MGHFELDIQSEDWSDDRMESIIRLWEVLRTIGKVNKKFKFITDAVNDIFKAEFTILWIVKEGDRCNSDSTFSEKLYRNITCEGNIECLHLTASSGDYSNDDADLNRIPLNYFKAGKFVIINGHDTVIKRIIC